MRLISLTLKNFQGVKELTLAPNGKDFAIYGDNGTGKTTVFNAFTWLLFDKPSTGAKNFTPKTRTPDGEVHGLDHTASAVLEHEGKRISLTKTYREIYKKKRGSIREKFDGHTTEYFVDGVPVKEKEYTDAVGAMWRGDAELAKILTMPEYFSEVLPWEKRRALLLELCGDVCIGDVFAANEELIDLAAALESRSVEDMMKLMHAKKSAVNKRLGELPGRLDEARRSTADAEGFDIKAAQKSLDDLECEKRALIEARAGIAYMATEEKRKELSALEVEMSEASAAYRTACIEQAASVREILAAAKEHQADIESELRRLAMQKRSAEADRDGINRRRNEFIDEYGRVLDLVFDESTTVCPCCHRPLPEEEVTKLREDFYLKKSARLTEINEKGKREASREMIAKLEADISEIEKQISAQEKELAAAKEAVKEAERAFPELPPFEETDTYREIAGKIRYVRAELADEAKTHAEALAEQDGKIRAVTEHTDAIRGDMARYNAALRAKERVDELLSEQKALAAEYEEAERMTYLCELFIKTKVSLLTDRINHRFENVRFSLFSEQINGGLKEECEVLVPSADGALVPYVFANHAARINAGIEIIGAISEHFGVEMPLFVDNAESVTHLAPGKAQRILLTVSEKDKTLRAEAVC
ncbi:MAG: hypothetical protein E7609_07960 [Ruminococcaceae bacterium]|nr:hypothetical protein [Oscillospiraceae bacterium]